MRVMDPEKDKRTKFTDCLVTDLSSACLTTNLVLNATALSASAGRSAAGANDGDLGTAWIGGTSDNEWIQFSFEEAQSVNEIRIREDPASSITRYQIQYADPVSNTWKSCFNGMHIGNEFVAPIVNFRTKALRLKIMATDKGRPAIREFEAYLGSGRLFNDPDGTAATRIVGK